MQFDEYQSLAGRTRRDYDDPKFGAAIYALGLAGEAGETADYIKKVVGHDHPVDLNLLSKELGDVLWYVAAVASQYGLSMGDIAAQNIDKLRARYPDGFSVLDSLQRVDKQQLSALGKADN